MLRYTALGLLIANRQGPWVLDEPTHYDAYIGLDVLNGMAAFTFFSDGGQRCFVRLERSQQKEKLLRSQVRAAVTAGVRDLLRTENASLRSIVLRRDGRLFACEWSGFCDALDDLKREDALQTGIVTGAVEIHKNHASGLRMVAVEKDLVSNPLIGSWFAINEHEGLICTTGEPFGLRGTVDPLYVGVVRGTLNLEWILQDTFAMSQLCWPVPDRCMRLPIDLKLCDDFLASVASEAQEDEAVYGGTDDPEVEETESVTGAGMKGGA